MNRYEGLFILDASAKDEVLKQGIDKIQEAIKATGGKVHNVQRMETRPFARPNSKRQSGYYVNFVFDAPPTAIAELDSRFHLEGGVYRWQFVLRPAEEKPDKKRRKKPEEAAPKAP